MIILKHNLAENRETGTCNSYVAADLVMKSLTLGISFFSYYIGAFYNMSIVVRRQKLRGLALFMKFKAKRGILRYSQKVRTIAIQCCQTLDSFCALL